jgi:4-amino-4-deoxy-L-arabinose transferase-like glycosyltransferase
MNESLDTSKPSANAYRWLIVITLFALMPYFFGLGMVDVRDMDEAAYGEIGREMIESGNFVDPTWNYVPFYEHPPLMLWLIASSIKVFGTNAYAVRLPGAALAAIGVFLTYLLGILLFDRKTAVVAAALLPTVPFYNLMIADARLDIALLVFITLAFLGVIAFLRQRKIVYLLIAYVACGLAFLTKGPIGIVMPALVVGVYIALTRKWGLIRELRPALGLLVIAAIVCPWYLFMYRRHGWDFVQNLVIRQNIERFFGGESFRLEDPSFYLHTFLWMFLPWVVPLGWMLIKKLVAVCRPVGRFVRGMADSRDDSDTLPMLLVIWLILPIIVMSLAATKQDRYIFFVFPAAALIAAKFIRDYLEGDLSKKETKGYGIFNIVLASLLGITLFWMVFVFYPFDSAIASLFFCGVVVFICLICLFSFRTDFRVGTIVSVVLLMVFYNFLYTTHISPIIMQYQPFRGFAHDIEVLDIPAGPIILYETDEARRQNNKPSLNFYSGRKVIVTWGAYMITSERLVPHLEEIGYEVTILSIRPHYDIITPTRREFLFAATRERAIDRYVLVHIVPKKPH